MCPRNAFGLRRQRVFEATPLFTMAERVAYVQRGAALRIDLLRPKQPPMPASFNHAAGGGLGRGIEVVAHSLPFQALPRPIRESGGGVGYDNAMKAGAEGVEIVAGVAGVNHLCPRKVEVLA